MVEETNEAYRELARQYLPGGVLGTFILPDEFEPVIVSGRGGRAFDIDGREYVDFLMAGGPLIAGHAHPEVVDAVQRQVTQGISYYTLNKPAILLAQKIVNAVPCAEKVRFASTGAEATFYALRLARAYTGRTKILKFEGAYHGNHDYAMLSVTPRKLVDYPTPVPDTAGIPGILLNEVLIAPYNDLQRTVAIIEKYADDLAAVIIEPQQRGIDPKPGFLQGLVEATRKAGAVMVFDEVVTGFRLGWGGAQEYYGVTPDLATYGKAIGGGFPVSAVAGKAEIMEKCNARRSSEPDYVYFSGTLNGFPVGAAAGLATLELLGRPGAYDRLFAAGDYMRAGLKRIAAVLDIPAQVVGAGPMFNILFTREEVVDYRTSLKADRKLMQDLRRELMRRGVIPHLTAKNYISLMHTQEDFDFSLQAFEDSLRALLKK